ncbi:SGNH/GDSL hydrolase family protein [Aeoliella mucimassa]|uniref:Phosphatidylcholine-sterol acyltransferase n=1 Tax=Aeoliella mucimassa TaxID=2527972 RepID=A0A518AIV8_9BACT|nr:SGNH/GDSL hydrolase family protein [Aeoliella mucimassa]QDU54657.1 Phosphatidylcholine-sterol acyltransferase precursor [Aeoliella mucimassa]
MATILQRVRTLGLTLLLLVGGSSAWGFSNLFFFGDSLSDVGNTSGATWGVVPGSDYYNGRFSNGPVYSELLYQQFGFGTLTPSRDGGDNYAYGGAQTTGTGFPDGLFLNDLDEQVDYFLDDDITDPTALHVVLIGANDLFQGRTSMSQLVTTVGNQITRLYNDGAREFLVLNLPKLGLTPRYNNDPALAAKMTAVTVDYNTQLSLELDRLELSLSELSLRRFDVEGLFDHVVSHPTEYRLTNVTQAAGPDPVVATPESYLFWDDVHPTATVHAELASLLGDFIERDSLPGDFNGDSLVDLADYTVWRDNLGASDEQLINNAGNGFAGVDSGDYEIWRRHFGQSGSLSAAQAISVPEPSSYLLLLLASLVARMVWAR